MRSKLLSSTFRLDGLLGKPFDKGVEVCLLSFRKAAIIRAFDRFVWAKAFSLFCCLVFFRTSPRTC